MGLRAFNDLDYQEKYVPQKLASLEICVAACHSVLSNQVAKGAVTLDFGSSTMHLANYDILIGIALDAGSVANRTLLNFLGLKLDNGIVEERAYGLTIENFSQPLLNLAVATKVLLPEIPEIEMKRLWADSLKVGSKSSAHFTADGAEIAVAHLAFACYATSKLVRTHFFQALNLSEPATLLNPKNTPTVMGKEWGSIDPRSMIMM